MIKIKNVRLALAIVGILFIGDEIRTQQNPYYYQGIPPYYPTPVAQNNPYGPPVYQGIPPYYSIPVGQEHLYQYGPPVYLGPLPGLAERSVGAPSSSPQTSDAGPKKKLIDTIDSFNAFYNTKDRSRITFIDLLHKTFKVGRYTLTIEPRLFDFAQLNRRDIKFFEPNELRGYPQILEIIAQLYGQKTKNNQGDITYEIIGQEDSSLEKFIMIFIVNERDAGQYELIKSEKISLSEIGKRNALLSEKIPSIIKEFNATQTVGDGATLKDIILKDFSFNLIISDPSNQLEITLCVNKLFDENTLLNNSFKEMDYSETVKVKSFSKNYPDYVNSYYQKHNKYPTDHHIFTKLVDVIVQRYGMSIIDKRYVNFEKIILEGTFQYLQNKIRNGQYEISFYRYESPKKCAHRLFRPSRDNNPFYGKDLVEEDPTEFE